VVPVALATGAASAFLTPLAFFGAGLAAALGASTESSSASNSFFCASSAAACFFSTSLSCASSSASFCATSEAAAALASWMAASLDSWDLTMISWIFSASSGSLLSFDANRRVARAGPRTGGTSATAVPSTIASSTAARIAALAPRG